MTLHVAGLWRYPVKSLAGESLTVATLTPEGIPGDRVVHVCGPEGVRTSRRHHRLLGLLGTLGSDARPRINGHPWDSPEALALIQERRRGRCVARSARRSRAVRHPASARGDRWSGGDVRAGPPAPSPEHPHWRGRGDGRNALARRAAAHR